MPSLNHIEMPYPRICAHRGFSMVAPENSIPALGAALALGAQEVEFDLWYTSDGEIVSIHDPTLERVSDGTGRVYEHTLAELKQLDFGFRFGEPFRGLCIPTFEEILKVTAHRCVMNIHIKTVDDYCEYDEKHLRKILDLLDRYQCRDSCYFMSGNMNLIRLAKKMAPDVCLCCGEQDEVHWTIVERAIDSGCKMVQLFKPYFNQAMIDRAHQHGIRCNCFWSDDPEEAEQLMETGVDCILTNNYLQVARALEISHLWRK